MKAIIMAGGEGRRLRPICPDRPKPMAPLLGRPIMEHIISLLRRNKVTDICVTLRYMPDHIMDYFGDGSRFGVRLQYRVEDQPLGTAGSVNACRDFFADRDFLVISGDAACDFNLFELMECHRRHNCAATLALYSDPEPLEYGLVLTDPRGKVLQFIEKPPWERVITNLINTGIYIISPRAMRYVPQNAPFDFAKDLFPVLMEKGEELRSVKMHGYWCDIGTPRAYYQCNLDAVDGKIKLELPEDELAQPKSEEPAKRRPRLGESCAHREIKCADRARLMRALSESLVEAGADFTDGLCLNTGGGRLRISPSPDMPAILIEAGARDAETSAELISEYEGIINKLNNDV